MKILDCTLRDGGYYTQWDFPSNVSETYLKSISKLPVDYLEIGYRSTPMKTYHGEFYYCPPYVIEKYSQLTDKKLAIILNEKDVKIEHLDELLIPIQSYVKMIRIAIDPKNFTRSLKLAEYIRKMGFEVCLNVMYMSSWENQKDFLAQIKNAEDLADYLYMVDSYGGVYPEDIKRIIDVVKSKTDIKLGFHGHNNLELALINTLTAIDYGVDIVDSTITGMGRGAGNLKTELLLTTLNRKKGLEVEFNELSKVIDAFTPLHEEHRWGTSLPYMVSGAYSLPQKDVMEWVTLRYYSLNSIIRALENKAKGETDNEFLRKLDFSREKKYTRALILGGGQSVAEHGNALRKFLKINPEIAVIHASSKNATSIQGIQNEQFFCLVGNEGYRLEGVFNGKNKIEGKCILPPYPRKMGTYIPHLLRDNSFELENIDFTDRLRDTHTALALQTAKMLGVSEVYFAGYDGYSGKFVGEKEQNLFIENEFLFTQAKDIVFSKMISLTSTKYKTFEEQSVYSFL